MDLTARHATRLQAIDGLRGLAALAVVVFHAGLWGHHPWLRYLSLGKVGVDLFLVLSGFCLTWPLVRGREDVKPIALADYARRRARRILPPFYAAVLTFCCAATVTYYFGPAAWWDAQPPQDFRPLRGWETAFDLASHGLLIHGFFNAYAHSLDGAFWSLSLEWQFYWLLIPLIWIARRWSIGTAFGVTCLITIAFRLAAARINPHFAASHVGDELSLAKLAEFGWGMLAAKWAATSVVPSARATWLALAFLFAGCVCEAARVPPLGKLFVWSAGFAFLVIAATENGPLRTILSWKPLVGVGVMSYSVYLTHGSMLLLGTIAATRFGTSPRVIANAFLLLGPPVAIAFAAGWFMIFERPFITTGRSPTPKKIENTVALEPAV